MTLAQRINAIAGRACRAVSPALEHRWRRRFDPAYWDNWPERTRQVMACPDNPFIPRVPSAGRVDGGVQIMHNGLKVRAGSYYGQEPIRLLQCNRGVHEPQEERVFQEVLKKIPPGAAMLELGAYWSFYSMWFCSVVPGARAFMVEPFAANLAEGKANFSLNNLKGHFTHAWVGVAAGVAPDNVPVVSVDDLAATHGLEEIALLHSDIQGAELDMLKGGEKILGRNQVAYTFISTHGEEIHGACDGFLRERGYLPVASIPPSESYSLDGILVHQAPHTPPLPPIALSRRPAG